MQITLSNELLPIHTFVFRIVFELAKFEIQE